MEKHQFIRQTSDAFQQFYKDKYITTRDGNACLKYVDREGYLVTASGVDKSYLSMNDFIEVTSDLKIIDQEPSSDELRPSIETQAHMLALKTTDKTVSIHVHSPKTVALFEAYDNKKYSHTYNFNWLSILENEIMTDWPELFRYTKLGKTVTFLAPGSKELHNSINDSFSIDKPDIIVLQRHGVLAVGKDVQEATEHICRLEHISSILLDIEKAK